MANGQIRIGIVGAGANTVARHIPGFKAIDGVRIAGVCNRTRQSTESVARQFGIPTVYDHWTEMIDDNELDAILIGTWPYLHCPVTLAALANGKHVLCEARMAMNAEEARRMLDSSRRTPALIAQLVPAPVTLRVDAMAQRLIAAGFLGDILAVEVSDCTDFPDWASPLHWREDADLSGLNTMTLGIWYECAMRWLGAANQVSASGRTVVKTRKDARGTLRSIRIPDHLEVTAKMDCGALAHYTISRVCGFAGQPAMSIYGSDGTIRFSKDTLEAGKRGDSMSVVSIPPELEGGWEVEDEFIRAIRGIEPVRRTTFEDGVRYMEFTQAVADSIALGKGVSIRRD